jgi:hypothetical protein
MSDTLNDVAYDLAEEIRDGKWDHVKSTKTKPIAACIEIIEELRKRRPGHTLQEYQRAIADAMFASR